MRALLFLLCGIAASLACRAQATPDAAPTTPSAASLQGAAAAGGQYLRRSQKVIKRALDVRDESIEETDKRNIDMAAEIARDADAQPAPSVTISPSEAAVPPLGEYLPAKPPENQFKPAAAARAVYIFVSDSMSDRELKDALEVAADNKATVLFRGVAKGQSIDKALVRVSSIARTLTAIPDIQIDPRPYEFFGIQTVPTVVVAQGADFVKVAGSLSVKYASTRFEAGNFGDAGSRGPTKAIVELDLIADMQERLSKIDFKAKARDAQARFWTNVEIKELPLAVDGKVTYFDPTVVNQDEIRDPEGNLIAPAGASFNPLDIVNFSKTIVVFDATSKRQLEFAKRVAAKEIDAHRGVILLTTKVDRERGWEAFTEYNELLFPQRVFLLDALVAGRFGLEAVPSVVRAEGRVFRIEQFADGALQ